MGREVVRTTWDALRSTHPTRLARRSIRVLDVGVRTIAAGGGLGAPVAFLVLVFDRLRVPGHALLGGGRARRRKRRRVGRERLREHAVDRVGPAVVVADDVICDMRHGCTCWRQRSTRGGLAQHRSGCRFDHPGFCSARVGAVTAAWIAVQWRTRLAWEETNCLSGVSMS